LLSGSLFWAFSKIGSSAPSGAAAVRVAGLSRVDRVAGRGYRCYRVLGPSRRARWFLPLAAVAAVAGCGLFLSRFDQRPICLEDLCVTPREFDHTAGTLTVDTACPRPVRLRNAAIRAADAAGPPCGTGEPVQGVGVDGVAVGQGPAAIDGTHRLQLRFRPDTDFARRLRTGMFLELDLEVGGQARCLRVPLRPHASGS
jgi:hypothetical protein